MKPPATSKNRPTTLDAAFSARLSKRVHEGLTVEAELTLDLGDRAILFGPSGAGKSTILRMIAGLTRPDEGAIRLGDDVLFDSSARRNVKLRNRRIGMIFQSDLLFPHLSVERNIRFGLAGWDRAQATARLREIAALCGVAPLLSRRPATLSGGERQRVGLARALAPRPRLLLCDEPVSALDLENRQELVDRLGRIQEAEAVPMIYVTHSPAEAIALGGWLYAIRGGVIVDEGPPLDALSRQGRAAASEIASAWNGFAVQVTERDSQSGEIRARIERGPELILPQGDWPLGSRLFASIRADEILMAREWPDAARMSARNRISAVVERIVLHDGEAEIIARTGDASWLVSVVNRTIADLNLEVGSQVVMIMKARSFRVRAEL